MRRFASMRISCFFCLIFSAAAQPRYDLILKGGHLVDARNSISGIRDIAIFQGKIAAVAVNIPASEARRSIDISSLYVVPGLVDIDVLVTRYDCSSGS